MRASAGLALAALGTLGACLGAPTGLAPVDATPDAAVLSWPPLGGHIIASGAGDLDGDGLDDLVVLDANASKVDLLRGGVGYDLDPTRATVTTATASAALTGLAAPAAVAVVRYSDVSYVVILDAPAAGPRLTVLDARLTKISSTTVTVPAPPGSTTVTLTTSKFGMSGTALFGTVPGGVFLIEANQLGHATPDVALVPSTGGSAFTDVMIAGGYLKTGGTTTPRVFVAERTLAQRSDAMAGGNFSFTTVRAPGGAWAAQVVGDLNGDGLPEVVGFDGNGAGAAQICAIDVDAAATIPSCFATPFGMDDAKIAIGPVLAAGETDLVLVAAPPGDTTMTSVFTVPRLHASATQVQADMASQESKFAVGDATPVLAQLDTGAQEVVLVGRAGGIACVRPALPKAAACAP
jgi:hypothetical protein